jgi:hypothetical protein
LRRLLQIIIIIPVFASLSLGQVGKDSLYFSNHNFSDRYLLNTFDKQLNTFNFNTVFRDNLIADNFFFGIKENFNSTIINAGTKNIKDEQYLWAIGQYDLSEPIKIGILLNHNLYSDDRDLAINKASQLTTSFYTKFQPSPNFEITPFAGFSQNEQIGEKDKGVIYGTEAGIDKYNLNDFELSSLLKYQNEDISPRKNTFRLVNVDLKSSFDEGFNNIITANYSQQRKDFYFTADPQTMQEFNIDNNIQSRTESGYLIQDRIRFAPPKSPLILDIQGRIAWRGIDRSTRYISESEAANSNYDTHIEESRLEFNSAADYIMDNVNLSLRFSFSERDEKHTPIRYSDLSSIVYNERLALEEDKDNTSQLANLSLQGRIILSRSDRITVSLFQRKLKYDTSSDQNFDDRDELLSIGRIFYERDFSPFFKAFVNFEGNLNKIVYIFAERSSNNNVKRILKFSAGGLFTAGSFSSSNSAEVSANYTVFDYEELNPNFKSYSFRQLAVRDSSKLQLNNKIRLFVTGYTKLSEQGDFKWSNFSSNPVRYLSEQYLEPKIFYDYSAASIGIGIRYFSLTTYNIQNGIERNKVSDYRSIGPLSEISFVAGDRILLKFYGWYEFIKTEDNSNRETVNISFKLSYKF